MNIAEMPKKIKSGLEAWFTVLVIILVAGGAFGLGRLSKLEETREPIRIETGLETELEEPVAADVKATIPVATAETKPYVASKNGSKYYLASCAAANRIKAENKIYFASKTEAEARGLTPAANCPGL